MLNIRGGGSVVAGRQRFLVLVLVALAAFSFAWVASACSEISSDRDDGRSSGRSSREDNEPRRTRTPRATPTPTVDRNRDSDDDGIPDVYDACPDEFDAGQW